MTNESMLAVRDVSVYYGRAIAVDGVSFELPAGESLALLGRNGAGKSSLLHAIAGLTPYSGGLEIQGTSLGSGKPAQRVRLAASIVLERRELFGGMSVEENLEVAYFGCGVRSGRAIARAGGFDRVYDIFPALKGKRHEHAESLSGGQQQMLAIARALIARPRLMLLDEPSIGLAPQMTAMVYDVLEQLKADGISLLVVEENPTRALQVADHVVVMDRGRIAFVATADEVRADPDMVRRAYFGDGQGAHPRESPAELP